MNRIFAILICVALAACMLTACGDDDIYREPGNGTNLGGGTTPAPDDDNGSYSADPDGDVNQTTDGDNVLDDIGDDIEQGIDDIGDGIEDIGDDITGNNNNGQNGNNGNNNNNGANNNNAPQGGGLPNGAEGGE